MSIRITLNPTPSAGKITLANNAVLYVSKVISERTFDGANLAIANNAGLLQPSQTAQPITLDNVLAYQRNRLDSLSDVVEGPLATNNSTLVYDVVEDKYVVKQLDLDGGEF